MSIKVMSRVWDEATDIRGGDLLVLLALADFADDEGRCWPSVATIAKKARLTERQAYRSLKALEASGHLHRNSSPGKRASYVLIPTPDKLSGDPGQDVTPDNLSPLTHSQVTPEQMSGEPLTSDPLPPTPPNKEEPSREPSVEPSITPTAARSGRRSAKRPTHEQPTLIPDDEPVEGVIVNGNDPDVRAIVAEWIDGCKRRPPGNVIGQVGKQLRKLVDEDFTSDQLRETLRTWQERDVHPSVLPSIAHSVVNGSTTPNRASQRMRENLAVVHRFQAMGEA